jgi:hypothetical protein
VFDDLLYRLRALVRRDSVERELDEELRWHLDHETDKLVSAGLSRDEASRQARLALGGMDAAKDDCRCRRREFRVEPRRPAARAAAVGQLHAYGSGAADVSAYLAAMLVMTMAGAIACWIPARRASAVEPVAALRED